VDIKTHSFICRLILDKDSVMWVAVPIDLFTWSFIPLPRFFNPRRVSPLLNQSLVLIPRHVVMYRLRGFVRLLFQVRVFVYMYIICYISIMYRDSRTVSHRDYHDTWLLRSFLSKRHMVPFIFGQVFLCIISVAWHFFPWLSPFPIFTRRRRNLVDLNSVTHRT
jgi:hypothetical protein